MVQSFGCARLLDLFDSLITKAKIRGSQSKIEDCNTDSTLAALSGMSALFTTGKPDVFEEQT
jgi:hypothetical protein